MSGSSYIFKLEVPREPRWQGKRYSREDFYAHLWTEFSGKLQGIHEGTLLTEEAFEAGLETESWTVDSAEAPRERDWIDSQKTETATLYFDSRVSAETARERVIEATGLIASPVAEQKNEDWDAQWKASFQGVKVPPYWEILPPWKENPEDPNSKVIRINPGAGFGTGTHETTQLCLQAVAFALRGAQPGIRVLDFGSGSGILSIAAARLGAEVDGVEIDPLAVENAEENYRLNLDDSARSGNSIGRVCFALKLEELPNSDPFYSVVIANILRPVLIEYAKQLTSRLREGGKIVLSGLIATDLPQVMACYSELLGGISPQIFERGEWRALVFERPQKT